MKEVVAGLTFTSELLSSAIIISVLGNWFYDVRS